MSFFSMVPMVIKNLFRKPVTEKYPFVPKEYFVGIRGRILIDLPQCIFCGLCQRKCPTSAIIVIKEGKKSWEIDRLRCIHCSYCVEVCPKKCLKADVKYSPSTQKKSKDKYIYA